ncbi:tyrosine recombinase XerC [Mycobacterium tuberculosis]|nr:tyrosine recombinase XerC [Mycobacterium tuberculosis]
MRRVDSGSRRHACDCGGVQAILDEFDEYLALQCGRSVHTRRAYLGDLRSLFAFLADRGSSLDALTLSVLRSWLAATAGAGAARTTLARRTSAVKAFTAWAVRRGLLAGDPAARLQVPKARRTLPAVLRQDQALRAMAAAESGAEQGDPLALRDRLIVELLYATGIRVSELCGLDVDDIDTGHRLVRVLGKGNKQRTVPFGQPAADALHAWLVDGRRALVTAESGHALLLGARGRRLDVRQARTAVHQTVAAVDGAPDMGRTGCGTARRPTCWKVAPTCGWSRSCSVIPAWRPRSCTPTSRSPGCGRCTSGPIRGPSRSAGAR